MSASLVKLMETTWNRRGYGRTIVRGCLIIRGLCKQEDAGDALLVGGTQAR